jgi:hypothetical protein
VGTGWKVHLYIILMSALDGGELLPTCFRPFTDMECLPERKLSVHQNQAGR